VPKRHGHHVPGSKSITSMQHDTNGHSSKMHGGGAVQREGVGKEKSENEVAVIMPDPMWVGDNSGKGNTIVGLGLWGGLAGGFQTDGGKEEHGRPRDSLSCKTTGRATTARHWTWK